MDKKQTEIFISIWKPASRYRLSKLKLKSEKLLSKSEIVEMLEDVTAYHSLSSEDKEHMDITNPNIFVSNNNLLHQYITTILQWNYYIIYFETLQEFEICNLIMQAINWETQEITRLLDSYYDTIDPRILIDVMSDARERSIDSYDEWINLIKK